MKNNKFLTGILLILFICLTMGAITTVTNWKFIDPEFEGNTVIEKIYLTPTDTEPTASRGWMYYDLSEDGVKVYNNSDWVLLGTSGSAISDNTLDMSYDEGGAGTGKKIEADSGAVEIEVDDTKDNPALHLDCDNTTNDPTAFLIENDADAANAISIDIDAQTTGRDIEGSGATWHITGAGVITSSGILMGPAAASTITIAANGADDDLTISVTGAHDNSLVLASEGTNTDAMTLTTTAGGIDILNGGAAGGEDIDITSTSASVNISAGEGAADAIVISAGTAVGGIDITSNADIDITTTGAATEDINITNTGGSIHLSASEADPTAVTITASANGGGIDISAQNDIDIIMTNGTAGEDIQLNNTGGSVNIVASENQPNAIYLYASDAAGGIDIDAGTGNIDIDITTGDFLVDCDLISIDGTGAANITLTANAGAEDLLIEIAGGQDASLVLLSDGTGTDALTITADAGGMDIVVSGSAADDDLDLDSDSSINITASEAAALDAIVIEVTGGASGIDIISLANIDITTTGAATEDITIYNAGGSLILRANENHASVIVIDTTGGGGTSEAITILNDQGEAANSILIDSTAGGIDVDAALSIAIESAEDEDDAIVIEATAGGIQILASGSAAGEDILITATGSSVLITATENNAAAITIATTGGGGSSEAINLTNDQGTGAASISLASTAGGITLAAGADDAIILSTGSGGINCSGDVLKGFALDVTDDTDGHSVLVTESGQVFTNQADANVQLYTLPAAATGLVFTFLDVEPAGAADFQIKATGDDTIAGGGAAEYYICKTDAVSQSVTLIAVNATEWIVVSQVGTWANDNDNDPDN